jgi:tetratricopeptide (TPR) repeat protein
MMQFDPNLSPKFAEGMRLMREQKFTEAVAVLEKLTADRPEVGEYWLGFGSALAASGRLEDSLAPLGKACAATPAVPQACYQLGRVYHHLTRYEEALAAYSRGEKQTESTQLAWGRAQTYEKLGRYVEADAAYREALAAAALRPRQSAEIQLQYAMLLRRAKKLESAMWQFSQILRKQPFWGAAWLEKARTHLAMDEKQEAAEALEQAIAHGERRKPILLALSEIYTALGNTEKANEYRKEAEP